MARRPTLRSASLLKRVIEAAIRLEAAASQRLPIAAFVSAMGSAGTIAAGEGIKREFPDAVTGQEYRVKNESFNISIGVGL